MRSTVPLRALKQFYTRITMHWDKTMLHQERVQYAKNKFKFIAAVCFGVWYTHEYIAPTPDVRFDIKMFLSSDFAHYVETNGAGGLDRGDECMYRTFSFAKGKLQENMANTPEYRVGSNPY
uniref:Uncharacterized protein n=1 Tax=Globodera rostochiensis TaxID=31243 RepID=A0A914HXE2_GLORO